MVVSASTLKDGAVLVDMLFKNLQVGVKIIVVKCSANTALDLWSPDVSTAKSSRKREIIMERHKNVCVDGVSTKRRKRKNNDSTVHIHKKLC